jgi:hypothetical protein
MRMLIPFVMLSLSLIALPSVESTAQAAVAAHHQGRAKAKKKRPAKAKQAEKKATKKPDKAKKNDRGFEL